MTRQLTAIIEREGGGYVALCPEVDVVSRGDTVAEARDNLEEALTLFFETASTEEIEGRLRDQVYVTHVEVAVGVGCVFSPVATSVGLTPLTALTEVRGRGSHVVTQVPTRLVPVRSTPTAPPLALPHDCGARPPDTHPSLSITICGTCAPRPSVDQRAIYRVP